MILRGSRLARSIKARTDFSVGCYCEDESRCHRSVLRELLEDRTELERILREGTAGGSTYTFDPNPDYWGGAPSIDKVTYRFINNGDAPLLMRNEGGNRNNWLGLQLIATKSNSAAVGAIITWEAGGKKRSRD